MKIPGAVLLSRPSLNGKKEDEAGNPAIKYFLLIQLCLTRRQVTKLFSRSIEGELSLGGRRVVRV